jgi:ABC-type Na+ efflux pump permease subunit
MPHFKSFTILSFVTFTCLAVYANTPSDDIIIEKENKTIEAILKAEDI